MNFADFVNQSRVNKDLINNPGARKLFDFLTQPEIVLNCIIFSNLRLPVLTGIAKLIEDSFGNDPHFPLTTDLNRQYVGKMIKYILKFYGYSPVDASNSEKQIRKFANASLFKTSAIYQKNYEAQLKIIVISREVENS